MTGTWTVVLAEEKDECRNALRRAIQERPNFDVVGEAAEGAMAIRLLDQLRPDLVFLDVDMPSLDGFDVLRALPARQWPVVVFCAGYEAPSVSAIESNDLDCLLKPFDDVRALRALDHVAGQLTRPQPENRARIERVLADIQSESYIERLPIRRQGKVEIVDLEDVEWIAAAGNYVELHSDGRRHLYRSPLSHLARRLDPRRFARIHRSVVVNVERVCELEPTPQGDWKLKLDTGARLRLSRRFREALDRIVPERGRGRSRAAFSGGSRP